jgi:hypothetical protein
MVKCISLGVQPVNDELPLALSVIGRNAQGAIFREVQ